MGSRPLAAIREGTVTGEGSERRAMERAPFLSVDVPMIRIAAEKGEGRLYLRDPKATALRMTGPKSTAWAPSVILRSDATKKVPSSELPGQIPRFLLAGASEDGS